MGIVNNSWLPRKVAAPTWGSMGKRARLPRSLVYSSDPAAALSRGGYFWLAHPAAAQRTRGRDAQPIAAKLARRRVPFASAFALPA